MAMKYLPELPGYRHVGAFGVEVVVELLEIHFVFFVVFVPFVR